MQTDPTRSQPADRRWPLNDQSRSAGQPPRFVVHLLVRTPDLAATMVLARAMARSLAFLPELDAGDTSVSVEGNHGVPHRVFCDRVLADRRRCARLANHDGQCRPETSR